MKIAELFTEVKMEGSEKTVKNLEAIQKGFASAESKALLMKAGIAAVIFGLERLTGFASQAGMDLSKFALSTGQSTDELQRWQHMAMMYDVTADEMEGTIRSLQKQTAAMMMGEGMPASAAALGIKMTRDPFNLLKQLTNAAKNLPNDVGNNLLSKFGISDNMIQMMRAGNFELDKMKDRDIITTGEIGRLTAINKLWKEFWFSLKTMGIKAVAKDGMWAVVQLSDAFKLLRHGGDELVHLMDQFKALKVVAVAIGAGIALAFAPITTVITGLLLLLGEFEKKRQGKANFIDDLMNFDAKKTVHDAGAKVLPSDKEVMGFFSKLWQDMANPGGFFGPNAATAPVTGPMTGQAAFMQAAYGAPGQTQPGQAPLPTPGQGVDRAVNIEIHNHGVTHPKETGEASKDGVLDAYNLISARSGGQ